MHSGDWNLIPAPVTGEATDAAPFKGGGGGGRFGLYRGFYECGSDGVSGSESDVAKGLEAEFKNVMAVLRLRFFHPILGA